MVRAYACINGPADDIPGLLRQLEQLPSSVEEDPWFSLWSALAHQGDVYSASFAAVRHVVHTLAGAPFRAGAVHFKFPAWIEICRRKSDVEIPSDLAAPYFEALEQLPLLAAAASRDWDSEFLVSALSAVAAAKGEPSVTEAVLELTPEVAHEFTDWFFKR
jgi:hypothetical protein